MIEGHCGGCKNKCPLVSTKCEVGVAMAKQMAAGAPRVCRMCARRCPLDALGCDLGKTIHRIKTGETGGGQK